MSLRQGSVLQYDRVAKKGLLFALLFLLVWVCPFTAISNPWKNLQSGDGAAQEFLNKINEKKSEGGSHPFYTGQTPKEANYHSSDLVGKSQSTAHQNPAAQMVRESSDTRAQFKIDPQKDPLITESQKSVNDPLKIIGGAETHVVETKQGGKDETLTCEEPGENSLESCTNQLVVKVKRIKIQKEWKGHIRFWMPTGKKKYMYLACGGLRQATRRARQSNGEITAAYKACMKELGHKSSGSYITLSPLDVPANKILEVKVDSSITQPKKGKAKQRFHVNCSGLIYNHDGHKKSWYDCKALITIVYEEEAVDVLPDEWVSNCDYLETRVDQGLCHYSSRACTQGPETRIIEGVPITRPCWQEKLTYACSYPSKDDCGPLRAKGCVQINSVCKQTVGNACVVYTQTYQCKGDKLTRYQIIGGQTPFCLDGNCREQSWETNDEMMSSLAQLSILKEMQGQIKNGTIFKGEDNRCSKYILSFKDCCGSGKGWGNDLGLSSCSSTEKNLSKKRKAKLCHYVGTFCAKKVLGQCIKKKSTFCCFGNKLLKAFHEQGRPQIGLGWGEPKEPLCRGFTIQEIQKIDFSKLDLREVFEDLMKNFKPGKMQNIGEQVGERLEVIKKGLTPNVKQPQTQGDKA